MIFKEKIAMSNLKRLLALAFAVLMIVGCLPASAKTFTDTEGLTEEENYAIGLLSDLSIILGKGDGSFGSEDSVNRKEMAIFASRLQTGEAFGDSYGENVTPFADVITDFEAILYAHNMGIVVGDESGLFRPNEAVRYQDVLTMIVRSLGYKGAEMDMGYPYSYVVKAKELGISEGVELSLTESVKRKQVALLLSNALFAEKENGESVADELFGIDTYVVTAAYGENLTGVDAHLAGGSRVVVQPLNSDGTINDMYYHIPAAEFKKAGLVATPGASFVISSMDNLETVKSITACPSVKLSNEGEEIFLTPNGKVEISRTDYKAVHRYSQVYNTQGTQSGEKEIIVYNQRGKSTIIAYDWFKTNRDKIAYLVIDSVGNIYGRDGEILVYYFAEDKDDPYKAYDEAINDFVDVTEQYIWDNAALSDTPHYDKIASLRTDAFGNILDADGYVIAYYMPGLNGGNYDWPYFGYDKATGTYYPVDEDSVWGKAEQYQDNTTHYYVWTGDEIDPATGKLKNPDSSFVLSNKNEYYTAIAYDDDFDGDYDRVFYSYSSAPMGSFTYVEGLVSAVSNNQMTIAGTQYRYSEYVQPDTYNKYIGMNVKATLCDGEIYSIGGCSSTWVIFEDYTALTKSGYAVANAFAGSSELRPIVVASVDGYFFMKNNLSFFTDTETNSIDGIYDKLKTGELYTATKDYYGYYHISTDSVRGQYIDGEWVNTTTIKFKNGISTSATLPTGTNYRFEADSNREFIIFNPETKSFITGEGFPSDGSTLEFAARKGVVGSTGVSLAYNNCVHFLGSGLVYFSDARFNGAIDSKTTNKTEINSTDVVYVSASAAANYSVDQNVTGLTGPGETIVGFRYVYKDSVLSLVSGDYVTVCTEGIFNYRLEVGFYYVINGVIDRKITDFEDDPDCPIALGRLEKMDIDTLRLVEVSASGTEGEVYEEELIKGRLYALNPNLDTLIQGGAWNFLSTFCRSNGLPVGPVNVFYAKSTLYTSSPVMIALPENRNDIWDKWGGK